MRDVKKPTLPFILLLAAGTAAVGSFVVWNFGSSRLGDPNVCEGLGFGCSPSQFLETLVVIGVLWASLLVAAIAARLVRRRRLQVLVAGIVLAGAVTFVTWNANVIRYSVPALTAEQAHGEMEHLLDSLAGAAGPGDPSHVPSGMKMKVASPPTPADVLRSIQREGPVPCLDHGRLVPDSLMLVWSRSTDVLVPYDGPGRPRSAVGAAGSPGVGSLPPEHVEQFERVTGALRDAGFEVEPAEQRSGPTLRDVLARREGPPLAERREGSISTTYRVHVLTALSRDEESSAAEIASMVQLETPCFRQ